MEEQENKSVLSDGINPEPDWEQLYHSEKYKNLIAETDVEKAKKEIGQKDALINQLANELQLHKNGLSESLLILLGIKKWN